MSALGASDRQVYAEKTVTTSSTIPPTTPRIRIPQPLPPRKHVQTVTQSSSSSTQSLRGYIQAFAGGMACAAILIWQNQPVMIPKTNLLTSPRPHLTPVYYRVFILGHPFYSPHHATPDDNTLGRFFLVDFEPPYTGARVTKYLMKRESLDQSRTAFLYANISAPDPVADDEIVDLVRGRAPVGNPDQALRLVMAGREGPEVQPAATVVHWKEATQSLVTRSLAPVWETPLKVTVSVLLSPALAFYAYVHFGGIGWY